MRGDRLEGLVVEPIDAQTWESAWSDGLRPLDAPLKRCVDQLGAAGALCRVVHYSPTSVAEVFSCPAHGQAAAQAALLALSEQSGVDPASNPSRIIPIARDRKGTPRQSHLLMAADRDASAASIGAWIERAGLRVGAIAPAEAGHLSWLVQRLVKMPDDAARIVMWLGSHRSALAVGGGGRLSLVRRLDIGVETLISALCAAPLTQDGRVRLSREEARNLISTVGIPDAKDDVDTARGLKGYHLLPLLQPILQKCIVELRQSIRFGLEEGARGGARLSVVGPGASVPRLGKVLSEQTEAELDPIAALDHEQSDLSVALLGLPTGCNLISIRQGQDIALKSIRRALWAGGIAAAIAAAALGTNAVMSTSDSSRQLHTLRPELAALDAIVLERDSGNAEIAMIERVLTAGDQALGAAPSYADFLRELTLVTPESVRLTDINYARTADAARAKEHAANRVELRGYAGSAQDGSSPDLTSYIQALSRSPLVAGVTLGATERADVDGEQVVRFSLTLSLVETLGNPARQASVTQEKLP